MKRTLLSLIALLVLSLGIFVATKRTPHPTPVYPDLVWESFQPMFSDTLRKAGFFDRMQHSCSADEVALPLSVQFDPRRWFVQPPKIVVGAGGFANIGEAHVGRLGNSGEIQCLARYLEGRACIIELRCGRPDEQVTRELADVLSQQFPQLPIRLRVNGL